MDNCLCILFFPTWKFNQNKSQLILTTKEKPRNCHHRPAQNVLPTPSQTRSLCHHLPRCDLHGSCSSKRVLYHDLQEWRKVDCWKFVSTLHTIFFVPCVMRKKFYLTNSFLTRILCHFSCSRSPKDCWCCQDSWWEQGDHLWSIHWRQEGWRKYSCTIIMCIRFSPIIFQLMQTLTNKSFLDTPYHHHHNNNNNIINNNDNNIIIIIPLSSYISTTMTTTTHMCYDNNDSANLWSMNFSPTFPRMPKLEKPKVYQRTLTLSRCSLEELLETPHPPRFWNKTLIIIKYSM